MQVAWPLHTFKTSNRYDPNIVAVWDYTTAAPLWIFRASSSSQISKTINPSIIQTLQTSDGIRVLVTTPSTSTRSTTAWARRLNSNLDLKDASISLGTNWMGRTTRTHFFPVTYFRNSHGNVYFLHMRDKRSCDTQNQHSPLAWSYVISFNLDRFR